MKSDILIERLIQRMQNASTDILKEIGKVLKEIGNIDPSRLNEILQELKYGRKYSDILNILSKTSGKNIKEINEILEKVAKKEQKSLKKYYKANNKDFIPYEDNIPLQMRVQEIANTTAGTYRNIADTRAIGLTYIDRWGNEVIKPMAEAYQDIIDTAVYNVRLGKETFQKALEKQVKTMADNGIVEVNYASGYHRRVDSSIRMNMEDAITNLVAEQHRINGQEFGYDAVEISVHEYPAKDHEDIQGHMFDLENYDKMQNNEPFEDVHGKKYKALKRVIGQWNCRHIAYSSVIGVGERYSSEYLEKIKDRNNKGFDFDEKHYTMYEGTQLQRQIETSIRKLKDQKAMAVSSGANADFIGNIDKKMNDLSHKYNQLCRVSGLPSARERMKTALVNLRK